MEPSDLAAHRPATTGDSSDDAIVGQDLDSWITSWDKNAERLFGYSSAEVLGRSISVLIPSERWPEEGILVSRIKRGERVEPFETVRRARSGQLLDVIISASPVRDDAGAIVGVSKRFRDITGNTAALAMAERQRQQLTAQLEDERARLVEAQSVAKVGSWHTDLSTMVVTWSAETYRMFETSPAEFDNSHQAFLSYVHPDDRISVDTALTQSMARTEPTAVQHRILLPDGRIKFVEERWVVSHDNDARPVRALGTCRDITEQKHFESRIQHLNRVYAVLSAINHTIARERDVSAMLAEACRIIVETGEFKMAWVALPGANGQLGIAAHAGAAPDTLDLLARCLHEAATDGHPFRPHDAYVTGLRLVLDDLISAPPPPTAWAAELRRASMARGYRAMAALPLVTEGEVLGSLNIHAGERYAFDDEELGLLENLAGDIAFALTAYRRQAEQQLTDAALRTSEARLRESLSELHDVSTRLNDAREQEHARMARDIHDHLGQALTALKLDVAEVKRRLKAGDQKAVGDRLDEMAGLIDGAVNDVRRVAAELRPVVLDDLGFVMAIKAYLLDVERRSGLQCVLTTELVDLPIATDRATALFRILQEALTNVIRHAGARRVHVALSANDDSARLVIHDDGCGIPAAERRNPRAIGLVGMRDRARLFGGSVTVAGGPGEGTTVVAALPLVEYPA
ncbi:MAG: PAS domain S-box protein [Acidobacteriota bacterium]|nr:PAS domain S-box protein [Acidobacteriota bacterium]